MSNPACFSHRFFPLLLGLVAAAWMTAGPAFVFAQQAQPLERWIQEAERLVASKADGYYTSNTAPLAKAADAIDQWAAHVALFETDRTDQQLFSSIRQLLEAKRRVDRLLDATLEIRGEFAPLQAAPEGRNAIRNYLRTTAQLIDLSSRLRYMQFDALNSARARLSDAGSRGQLMDLLLDYPDSIGAVAMASELFSDPSEPNRPGEVADEAMTLRWLRLVARAGHDWSLLARLAQLVEQKSSPTLAVAAAETIRQVGLPQEARPDPIEELPAPPITPAKLYDQLAGINPSQLAGDWSRRQAELLAWLEVRKSEGIVEPSYRLGAFDVQPGDWLLMHNPSPYNLFTDLAPGLFTHVGVVALEQGSDGLRRMVVVDLPERGTHMPATNVETYVQRTLHYVLLRHPDAEVAKAMGEAARSVIGNEAKFDLNFRTDRVLKLKGQPLAGKQVNTYCAGLLLLCALQSAAPREEFFPIREEVAGGLTAQNLAKLGLSVGEDFISPTGALFSGRLQLVGRREPMYDPRREIEMALFDHFAQCLEDKTLVPAPDLFQSLRLKMAEAAKHNPLLAQALAKAAGVNTEIDLVAAAKAAAVVETLDEIAYGMSEEFLLARDAILAGPAEALAQQGFEKEDLQLIGEYRRRHADLAQALHQRRLSPRSLRVALVRYYILWGKQNMEKRFFSVEPQGVGN